MHTKPLTDFFQQSFSVEHINSANELGSRGRLTLAYVRLLKEVLAAKSSVAPYEFKNEVGQLASQFDGYDQHDASELLECVLDGVHEDLNRVAKKVYSPSPQSSALFSDNERAKLAWSDWQSRNSSIITDFLGGQYRSQITCRRCGKVSVTFDPYLTLHLNIPCDTRQELDFTYVPADAEKRAMKLKIVTSTQPTRDQLKREVAAAVEKDVTDLLLVLIANNVVQELDPEEDAGRKGSLYFYEVRAPHHISVWVNVSKTFPQMPGNQLADSYPRLLKLPRQANLKAVHLEVFRFLKMSVDSGRQSSRAVDSCEDEVDLENLFELTFPSLFGEPGVDLYTLSIVNLTKSLEPCEHCSELYCQNCPLPFDDTLLKRKFLSNHVQLNAVFSSSAHSWLSSLRQTIDHPSVAAVSHRLFSEQQRQLTLYDCFEHTGKPEELDEDNTAYCSQCKDQVQIVKQIEVWSVPKVLLVVLKRFKQHGMLTSKVSKVVDFPLEALDLAKYVLNGLGGLYDLYAVSNHIGSLGYGHYTACVKSEGLWYELDDSRVTLLQRSLEPSGAAYVLCYQRREA
jgi:ubiquitin carboxyl-terminal hydrolase 4/11/15